ncbi:hypothetical protein LCGC14_0403490 [marine sediment metagenome]|uniref:Uncharacterized protein n=1 Tax=marine sediment metagenome TaxID=412755 RepID=A0A0F9VI32_9ZZZZ
MSHAKIKTMFPGVPEAKKLSQVKDKDEKRFMVDGAFFKLERLTEITREVDDMKENDPDLFAAAQAKLDQKIADLKAAKTI